VLLEKVVLHFFLNFYFSPIVSIFCNIWLFAIRNYWYNNNR